MTAVFYNPYSRNSGNFSYGFSFRDSSNEAHFVIVSSNSVWEHYTFTAADNKRVASGTISDFDATEAFSSLQNWETSNPPYRVMQIAS